MNESHTQSSSIAAEMQRKSTLHKAVYAKSGAERMRWLRIATELGSLDAQFTLGCALRDGRGVRQDYRAAMKIFLQLARVKEPKCKSGSPQTYAMVSIGQLHQTGRGVTPNEKRAIQWFRKAASYGEDIAYHLLGYAYLEGAGVPQNARMAYSWFLKAALAGDRQACFEVGDLLAKGRDGIRRDCKMAVSWFRRAAIGYPWARTRLGLCYLSGEGVERNARRAIVYFRQAQVYDCEATYHLALCYLNGTGVRRDLRKARKLLLNAGQNGCRAARRMLPSGP